MQHATGSLSFSSADVDQTVSVTSRLLGSHRLIVSDSSAFRASLSRTQLGWISFNRLFYGAELEVRAESMGHDVFLMEVPLSGTSTTSFGSRQVHEDESTGCILAPTAPFTTIWSADCSKLLVTIDRSRAENQLSLLLGRSLPEPLAFEMEVMLTAPTCQTMRALIDIIAMEAEAPSVSPGRAALHASLETAFLSALLLSQPHNYSELVRLPSASTAAPWYVRRAEEFIRKNFDQPVTLSQLAATIGVSERTLQIGFRRFRGGSPMAWLRDFRMEQAKQLFETTSGRISVGELARAVGYGDMSKFAQAFRNRFGVTPREALQRFH